MLDPQSDHVQTATITAWTKWDVDKQCAAERLNSGNVVIWASAHKPIPIKDDTVAENWAKN